MQLSPTLGCIEPLPEITIFISVLLPLKLNSMGLLIVDDNSVIDC